MCEVEVPTGLEVGVSKPLLASVVSACFLRRRKVLTGMFSLASRCRFSSIVFFAPRTPASAFVILASR